MAEYFPLIERAIAGLPENTPEARRSIYERARAALIGQLRKTEPAVPEEDIARESTALDEAIARVEAKFADHGTASPAAGAAAPPTAPPAGSAGAAASGRDASRLPRLTARLATAAPTEAAPAASRRPGVGAPALPTGKAPPVLAPPARERPVMGPAPTVPSEPRPAIVPARPLVANRPRPTLPIRPDPVAAADPAPLARAAGEARTPDPSPPALPPAPDLAMTRAVPESGSFETILDDVSAGEAPLGADGVASPPPASARPRDAAQRPAAPRPVPPRRFGWPAVLVLVVVGLVMIGVGIAAWTLRDRPDRLAATHPVAKTPDPPEAGKIVDRAASGQDAPKDAPSSGAAVPAPVGQNGGGDVGSSIAVAQRAALLVDAPDEPQKLQTYSGTVVWHLDSVSPGQGLPLALAIKADIDIPDAKLKVTMVMQKNPEPQLPASHTIELHFLPQPGYTLGQVIQINMPDLRKDNAPSGDALAGVPVTIDADNFLVGLSRGAAAEAQNKRLITERNWFDVGLLLKPQRAAKLTFEKGADGTRLWEQTFAAWGDAKGGSATAQ